jgi:hypothetical protein
MSKISRLYYFLLLYNYLYFEIFISISLFNKTYLNYFSFIILSYYIIKDILIY